MNECPRCLNNNLKEDYKYCPICGLELGTAPEVPVQEQQLIIFNIDGSSISKVLTKNLTNHDNDEEAVK